MRNMTRRQRFGGWLGFVAAMLAGAAAAQVPVSRPTATSGAQIADLGAASPADHLDRMLLLLEPSVAQKEALDAELSNHQNPKSAQYHHWLTPSEFADTYANSASDVAAIVSWLQAEGFQVA